MKHKRHSLSTMPSEKLIRHASAQHRREDLVAQIDTLQALLKAERLKSAKLAYQLQEARNEVQAA